MAAAVRRSRGVLAAFSATCLPYAALGLPLFVTLPEFYASHVGVDLAVVGAVFLLIRLADIVIDPLLGSMIDGTRSRWGRYRLWMAASAPPLMLAVYMLFNAEPGAGGAYLTGWLVLLSLAFTISLLSQMSWAAVLSPDYDERSRVFGWWQTANIVGVLAVIAIPVVVQSSGWGDYAYAVSLQGWFIICLLPVTLAVTLAFTPEPSGAEPARHAGLFDYFALLRLPSLRRLLGADLLLGTARGVVGALFFYFFEAVQGFERAETSILLVVYFVFGLIGAPVWTAVAVRIGKHQALAIASLWFGCTLAAAAFGAPALSAVAESTFGPAPWLDLAVAGALVALVGLAFASGDLLLRAMMADVVDEVRLEEGRDRTGLLFAVLTATSKLGYAVSVVTFNGLKAAGFDPAPGAANSPEAIFWLQLMFAGLPFAALVLTAWVLRRYPLNAERHASIRAALAERASAG